MSIRRGHQTRTTSGTRRSRSIDAISSEYCFEELLRGSTIEIYCHRICSNADDSSSTQYCRAIYTRGEILYSESSKIEYRNYVLFRIKDSKCAVSHQVSTYMVKLLAIHPTLSEGFDIPATWNQISEKDHLGDLMHQPENIIFNILIIRW